jgi:hypothetical protein
VRAHKELQWEVSDKDGTFYRASGYTIYLMGTFGWSLEGNGLGSINRDLEKQKQRAQDHYNRTRQLKAWEDYMLTHEPPEN